MNPDQVEEVRKTLDTQLKLVQSVLNQVHPEFLSGVMLCVVMGPHMMFSATVPRPTIETLIGHLHRTLQQDPSMSIASNSMAEEPYDKIGVDTPNGLVKWGPMRRAMAAKNSYEEALKASLVMLEAGKITEAHKIMSESLTYHGALDKL